MSDNPLVPPNIKELARKLQFGSITYTFTVQDGRVVLITEHQEKKVKPE